MICLSETHWFLQSSSFWEARRALIGQLSSALRLAEYLKRVIEMLRPHRIVICGGVFEWAVLGGRGRVLTLIKKIFLGLRL